MRNADKFNWLKFHVCCDEKISGGHYERFSRKCTVN